MDKVDLRYRRFELARDVVKAESWGWGWGWWRWDGNGDGDVADSVSKLMRPLKQPFSSILIAFDCMSLNIGRNEIMNETPTSSLAMVILQEVQLCLG